MVQLSGPAPSHGPRPRATAAAYHDITVNPLSLPLAMPVSFLDRRGLFATFRRVIISHHPIAVRQLQRSNRWVKSFEQELLVNIADPSLRGRSNIDKTAIPKDPLPVQQMAIFCHSVAKTDRDALKLLIRGYVQAKSASRGQCRTWIGAAELCGHVGLRMVQSGGYRWSNIYSTREADRPNAIKYLSVDDRYLIDTSPLVLSSSLEEATKVLVRGFLQTPKISWNSMWEHRLPDFAWRPVRGGFCGNEELEKALHEIRLDTDRPAAATLRV